MIVITNDRSSSSLPNLHDNGPKVDEGENEAYEQLLVSLRLGSDDEIINNIINIMFERPLSDKIQDSGLQNIWYLLLKNDDFHFLKSLYSTNFYFET